MRRTNRTARRAMVIGSAGAMATALVAGCRASDDARARADLRRDLDAASAAAAFAPALRTAPATRFVSALELGEAPAPAPAPHAHQVAPAPVARPSAARAPVPHASHARATHTAGTRPSIEVAAASTAASRPAPNGSAADAPATSVAPAAEVASGPSAAGGGTFSPGTVEAPAPASTTGSDGGVRIGDTGRSGEVAAGSSGPRRGGGLWGGILGAVIRGGTIGDDDHCEILPSGRRRPVPAPTGSPPWGNMPMPTGRPARF